MKPTVREIYNQYKPVIKKFILADDAYKNARRNSDMQNTALECTEAIKRAVLTV